MKKLILMAFCFITTSLSFAQVSVTATAGTTGPTAYVSLNAAFGAINSGLHQGVITLSITGNTTEPSTPTALLKSGGTSSYTSILVKPVGGDWIIYSPNQADNTVMVDLDGADNVTFDGDPLNSGSRHLSFVIAPLSGVRTAVFRLSSADATNADGAQNNTIKNCIITGSRFNMNATTNTYGIYMASVYSAISISNLSAYDCTNNRFENNSITRCHSGIIISGNASFPATGLVIIKNIIGSASADENIAAQGISLTNTSSLGTGSALVEGNDIRVGTIDRSVTTFIGNVSMRGIALAQGNDGCLIRKNHIHDIMNPEPPTTTTGAQAFGIAITTTTQNNNIVIENNIVRNIIAARIARASNTAQGAYGIHINAAVSGIRINYNTVVLDSASVTGSVQNYLSACVNFLNTSAGAVDMKNNIFINKQGNDSSYAIRAASTNIGGTALDYNDYFVVGGTQTKFALYNGADVSTLANWQSVTSKDANSLNINPVFVAANNLHLAPSSTLLDGQGVTIAGITTDIDGDTRSTGIRPNGPDIGADEYVPGCNSASGGSAIATPAGPFCGTASTTISATGYSAPGFGITYTWQQSPDAAFTTPADIGSPSAVYNDLATGTISATTYYRLKVVCSTGAITAYSNGVPVTVTIPPSATISYTGSPYCLNGGTATVLQTGTTGGVYSAIPAGLTIHAVTGNITLGSSSPGNYTVNYTIAAAGGCPLFSTSAPVTVNANPNAGNVTGVSPLCVNATATYSTNGDAGGTWSSSNPLVASVNPTTGQVNALGAGTTNIIYTVTTNGCTSTTQATLNVTANPNAGNVTGASPLCVNSSALYATNGDAGGTWSSSNPLVASVNPATGQVNALGAGTANIIYTITSNGCTSTAQASLLVHANPNAGTVSGVTPVCQGSSVLYTGNGDAGGTWSSSNPAIASVAPATGLVTGVSGGTAFIIYTVTSNGCVQASQSAITVTPTPSATISYNGSPYCLGAGTAVVTQTGNTGGSYSSTPAGLSLNPSTGEITLGTSNAGTYTVTYSITASGGCPAFSTSASVTLSSSPTATISYTGSPYCTNGGTAFVTRVGTGGGTYSASPAGLSINSANGDINLSLSAAGTYTVSYLIAAAGGCSSLLVNTSVTINLAPNGGTISGASPVCSGSNTLYATNGTAGGTWSSSNAAIASVNPATGMVTGNSGGSATIFYSITVNGCTASSQAPVVVTQAPSASISYAGSPYCSNGGTAVVTLTGTSGGSYSAPAGLSINNITGAITLGTSTPGLYTVTYTISPSGGCGTYSTTAPVQITANPSAGISYTGSPYCSNSGTVPVTLTGDPGGVFSAPVGLSINNATGAITTGTSSPGNYTVTYTIAAAGGCGVFTTSTNVTITTLPAAAISYPSSPFCANSATGAVTLTGTAGGTFSALPAGLGINAATGTITPAASVPGNYTVTYTLPASGGCPSVNASSPVTVTAIPNATISYSGSPYCSNVNNAPVTQTGTAGGTYSAAAGLSLNAGTGAVNPALSTPGSYTVTYTVPAGNGCSAYSTSAAITITTAPAATINFPGTPYCMNSGSVAVVRTGTAGGVYSATPAGLSINVSTGAVDPGNSLAGTYTITYSLAAAGGCSAFSTSTSLTINAVPVAGSLSGVTQLRRGGTGILSSTGNTGGVWSSTNPAVASVNNAGLLSALSIGTTNIVYTVSAGGCAPVSVQQAVTVFAASLTNFYPNPATAYLNMVTVSDMPIQRIRIRVTDMQGRTVMLQSGDIRQGLTLRQLDVRALAGGMYFVTIHDVSGMPLFEGRFMKQ